MKKATTTGAYGRDESGADGARRGLVVAVVGSRAADAEALTVEAAPRLWGRLLALHEAGELARVVSGGGAGPDSWADCYADVLRVPFTCLRPDYAAHGPAAPHIRNAAIVAAADLVLVVWDGTSKGTLSAARHAARLSKPCEWLLAPAPADLAAKPAPTGPSTGGAGDGGQLRLL